MNGKRKTSAILSTIMVVSFFLGACGSSTPTTPVAPTLPVNPSKVSYTVDAYGKVDVQIDIREDSAVSVAFYYERPKADVAPGVEYEPKWFHVFNTTEAIPFKKGHVNFSGYWFTSSVPAKTRLVVNIISTGEKFDILSYGGGSISAYDSKDDELKMLCEGYTWFASVYHFSDPGSPLGMALYVDDNAKPIITFSDGAGLRSLSMTKPNLEANLIEFERDARVDHASSIGCVP